MNNIYISLFLPILMANREEGLPRTYALKYAAPPLMMSADSGSTKSEAYSWALNWRRLNLHFKKKIGNKFSCEPALYLA